MLVGFIVTFIASFMGTLGFGVLLNAPKKSLFACSLLGALGYCIYWLLLQLGVPEAGSMLVGALVASIVAQIAARKMQMIVTIFVTMAIIPLVPGRGLYRCMSFLAQGQNSLGAREGVIAMINILMIALGISIGSFLYKATLRLRKA